jgi:hypothetical protein
MNDLQLTIEPTPAREYFTNYRSVSQSMLKTFMDRRRLYDAYYVSRTDTPPNPTPPMQKGTATHTALLEPERFSDLVLCYPKKLLAKNGAVSTNEAKAFRDENEAAGRVVMKEADYANVKAMAESVRKVCGKWLALSPLKEHSIYWDCEETGLRCKLRADFIVDMPEVVVCLDLKTTGDASPQAFRSRVEDGGYWLQDATYREGIGKAFGKPVQMYFLAVEDGFPYATATHRLDDDSITASRNARSWLMDELSSCLESGDWSEPWERTITPLAVRPWAFDKIRSFS